MSLQHPSPGALPAGCFSASRPVAFHRATMLHPNVNLIPRSCGDGGSVCFQPAPPRAHCNVGRKLPVLCGLLGPMVVFVAADSHISECPCTAAALSWPLFPLASCRAARMSHRIPWLQERLLRPHAPRQISQLHAQGILLWDGPVCY